ncbi:hypothetical protein AO738_27980 [Pseudomonas citronellolis]|nr:hypothetical protein AO742_04070 [Pseudomonas citronellolis]KRW79304.1 hypothetical protein AO738_27980 [Pseudomonas citronellolis]
MLQRNLLISLISALLASGCSSPKQSQHEQGVANSPTSEAQGPNQMECIRLKITYNMSSLTLKGRQDGTIENSGKSNEELEGEVMTSVSRAKEIGCSWVTT